MSEESQQSKRERQKERRAAKREAQARAAAAAKRRRTLATVGVALLVVAGIGALLSGQIRGFFDRRSVVAEAEERLADFGCTPIEEMPELGGGHFSGQPEELAGAPPEAIYDHRPTTSGPHLPVVVASGVYDDYIDERLTTHNLEHGYVAVWWDPELEPSAADAVKAWAEAQMDDGRDKIVAAPYEGPLPDGGSVAFAAWDHRQLCDEFDEQIAEAFLIERHDAPDVPEAGQPAHMGDAQGELDPAEDAVVFTPFTDAVPGDPASAQSSTPDESGEDGDDDGDEQD